MIDYPIIDIHVHLRNNPDDNLKIIKESGISEVVAMANTQPVLDTLEKIKAYKRKCQNSKVKVYQISAITKDLEGRELVDIESLKNQVVGLQDDGKCLTDLGLLEKVFSENVLIMAHLDPEAEFCRKYIEVLKKAKKCRLHIQHVSRKETVSLIREAKSVGLPVTAETCPHYLYLNNELIHYNY